MIDLGQETHFWGCHGVLFREEQFELEYTICDKSMTTDYQYKKVLTDMYDGQKTYVGKDFPLVLVSSHRNTVDYPHEEKQ